MRALEQRLEANDTETSLMLLNEAKARHTILLNREADFWNQKAKIKWLAEGDENTKFFHNTIKAKYVKLRIQKIRTEDGGWVEEPQQIADMAISFFHDLLSDELKYDQHYWEPLKTELETLIPKLVTEDDNLMLQDIPNEEEIKNAVFSIDPNSSAGPDGFSAMFFQKCWDTISQDLITAI